MDHEFSPVRLCIPARRFLILALVLAWMLWMDVGHAFSQVWAELGPALGGRLSAIKVLSEGGGSLLVASPGGGVWYSSDGGKTWKPPQNSGLTDYSVTHLEEDIIKSFRFYAMTWNGLYATTNFGKSWNALINPGGTPAPIRPDQILPVDPKPFAQLKFSRRKVAVFASPPCSGLFYSFDGETFVQHWPFAGGSGNPDNCIGTIAADPISKRVYFSTMFFKSLDIPRVYRSNCDPVAWGPGMPCLNWELVNTGLPQSFGIAAMVATPGSEYKLVAAVKTLDNRTSFYASADGSSWKWLSTLGDKSWDPRELVWAWWGKEMFHGNVRAYHTLDLVNWTQFKLPDEHVDVRAIDYIKPAHKVWTVTDGSGNQGNQANVTRWSWTVGSKPKNGMKLGHKGLKVWQAYYAGVVPTQNPRRPRRVFVGSQDNYAVCFDLFGTGKTWTHEGASDAGGDSFAIQFAPSNPDRAYAWGAGGDPTWFRRTSNARTAAKCADVVWETITPTHDPPGGQLIPPRYWSRNTMAIHPTNVDRLYFAFSNNVGVSTNAGVATPLITHHELPGDPTPGPTAIYVDSTGAIYVGTAGHGAYNSINDGQDWTEWGLNTNPPAIVTAITHSGGANPTFWMATTKGLYKGTAAGGPWVLTKGGFEDYIVSDVAVDPNCPTRLYAAFGFGGWRAQHPGGIAVTWDGENWKSITWGTVLHKVPITDVEVDPIEPKWVYAASYGRGFWFWDWGFLLPTCRP